MPFETAASSRAMVEGREARECMTDQSSDRLENQHSNLNLGAWLVFGVVRGTPSKQNHGWGEGGRVYRTEPGEATLVTTGNWRGFHESWRLRRDGRLV